MSGCVRTCKNRKKTCELDSCLRDCKYENKCKKQVGDICNESFTRVSSAIPFVPAEVDGIPGTYISLQISPESFSSPAMMYNLYEKFVITDSLGRKAVIAVSNIDTSGPVAVLDFVMLYSDSNFDYAAGPAINSCVVPIRFNINATDSETVSVLFSTD